MCHQKQKEQDVRAEQLTVPAALKALNAATNITTYITAEEYEVSSCLTDYTLIVRTLYCK